VVSEWLIGLGQVNFVRLVPPVILPFIYSPSSLGLFAAGCFGKSFSSSKGSFLVVSFGVSCEVSQG